MSSRRQRSIPLGGRYRQVSRTTSFPTFCLMLITLYLCCMIYFMWRCSNLLVGMVVADVSGTTWHQGICKCDDEFGTYDLYPSVVSCCCWKCCCKCSCCKLCWARRWFAILLQKISKLKKQTCDLHILWVRFPVYCFKLSIICLLPIRIVNLGSII